MANFKLYLFDDPNDNEESLSDCVDDVTEGKTAKAGFQLVQQIIRLHMNLCTKLLPLSFY